MSRFRRYASTGKNHFLGKRGADDARQELRAADAGKDPTGYFRHREDGAFARNHKIRQHRQFTSATHGKAFHGGNDRMRAVQHVERRLLENDVLIAPRVIRHALAFFQITADTERLLSRTGQDHDSRPLIPE